MHRLINRLLAAAATLVLLGTLPSCSQRSTATSLTLEVGFDPTSKKPGEESSSTAAKPSEEAAPASASQNTFADDLARQFAATIAFVSPQDTFVLRATDNKTSLITTTLPDDENAAYTLAQSILGQIVPITDLATYFEAVADAADHSQQPVVIVLYSDGLDDGDVQTAMGRIEAAAHRLAANPRVRAVLLIGLVRDTRTAWKGLPEMLACLNEGPEKRLYVQSQAAMDPNGVARVLDAIRATPLKTHESKSGFTATTR